MAMVDVDVDNSSLQADTQPSRSANKSNSAFHPHGDDK